MCARVTGGDAPCGRAIPHLARAPRPDTPPSLPPQVSHVYELHLAGYRFVVLPDVFAIHMDHPVPKWRAAQNVTRVWVNWYAFIYDREREHGGGLFSPNSGGVSGGDGSASRASQALDAESPPRASHCTLHPSLAFPAFCSDTCQYAKDGACDDGGPGSDYSGCSLGTDCTDCGDRTPAEWKATLRLQGEREVRRAQQQRVLARRRALAAAGMGGGDGEDDEGDVDRPALTDDAAAKLQEVRGGALGRGRGSASLTLLHAPRSFPQNAELASRTAAECQVRCGPQYRRTGRPSPPHDPALSCPFQEALEDERAAGRQLQRRSSELESTVRQLEARVDRAVRERNTAASTLAQVQDALVRAEDMF